MMYTIKEVLNSICENIAISILFYNSFLVIYENIKYRRKSKADIAFSMSIIIMTVASSYCWLELKGFL